MSDSSEYNPNNADQDSAAELLADIASYAEERLMANNLVLRDDARSFAQFISGLENLIFDCFDDFDRHEEEMTEESESVELSSADSEEE